MSLFRSGNCDKDVFEQRHQYLQITQVVRGKPQQFLLQKTGGKKGIRPSTHSVNQHGELFENTVVIQDIEKVLHQEFCCYGYRNMSGGACCLLPA